MATMKVWIVADVLKTGLVHEVEARVENDLAGCRVGGIARIFRDDQWACTKREACVMVRRRVRTRLKRLDGERAKLEGILAGLGRGELPGMNHGESGS